MEHRTKPRGTHPLSGRQNAMWGCRNVLLKVHGFVKVAHVGVNPKIGVGSQNGWFIMENPIFCWMISGYHYFWKHSCCRIFLNSCNLLLVEDSRVA